MATTKPCQKHDVRLVESDERRQRGALVEPLSCAVHGLDQVDPRVAEDYLIYGAGTMGLLLAQLAKESGASRVEAL